MYLYELEDETKTLARHCRFMRFAANETHSKAMSVLVATENDLDHLDAKFHANFGNHQFSHRFAEQRPFRLRLTRITKLCCLANELSWTPAVSTSHNLECCSRVSALCCIPGQII